MKRWLLLFIVSVFAITSAFAGFLDVFDQGTSELWNSQWDKSVQHFQQAASIEKNHPLAAVALFNAANVEFLVNNNPEKAVELFQQVVDRSPESVWAAESYHRMAEIALSQEKKRQAADYYGKALQAGSSHQQQLTDAWFTEISLATANILNELGDLDATITLYRGLYEKITDGQPAAQVRFGLAQALESKGDLKQAAQYYQEIADYYPYSQVTRGLQSKRDLLTNQLAYDWSPFDLLQQSQALLRTGNRPTAADTCQRLVDNYPNSPLLPWAKLVIIGNDAYSQGNFRNGIGEVTNLILDNPGWPGSLTLRTTVERWENLANLIDDAKNSPDDLELHSTVGFQLMGSRAMELAQTYFNHVLQQDPENPNANLGMGNALLALGNTEQAVPHFEAYLKTNPNDGTTFNQLGYAFLQVQQFDKAHEMFQRYINADTTEANAYDSMGECLFNEGKYDESVIHYRKALLRDPTFTNSQFMLGEVYKANHDTSNAIDAYQRYLEMDNSGGRFAQLTRANLDSLKTSNQ